MVLKKKKKTLNTREVKEKRNGEMTIGYFAPQNIDLRRCEIENGSTRFLSVVD